MTQFDLQITLGVVLLGIVFGGAAVWLMLRARRGPEIDAAVAQARAAANVQLATATVKAEQAESGRQWLQAECGQARQREERLAAELAAAQRQNAQLAERAARIPDLESQLAETRTAVEGMGRALADLRETSGRTEAQLTADLRAARDGLASTTAELQNERSQRNAVESDNAQLGASLKGLEERHEAEQRNTTEKLHLLLDAKEALTNQFKSLANDILEEKSRRFTEQNQANLTQLLDPLRANITAFQAKVEEVYVQEGKDRSALSQHVRQLFELTQTLSKDAKNLTSALRGSSRTQGSWGELVLERILEASGLRKGEEYVTQESQGSADGRRQQPDVVINLPEQRSLVVDAKVSLVAYERFVAAETDSDRDTALRQHLDSVRTHIRGLSERNYQALYGLNSLDFVLMFVPVEPAFMLAVTNEPELFMDAWHRNVLLVSPSTLLFVLRTVGHLWRQEAQRRNAQEIADRGGELYDRLVLFAEDLKVVGDRINAAQSAYACAESKLSQGKGNVIWQAEMLRELGVTPSKQIPQSFLELTAADEDGLQIMPVAGTNRAGSNSPSIDSAH